MIKFEHTEVVGWEHAIRGMRNPLNSWGKSDSVIGSTTFGIGPNDIDLMQRLVRAGTDHRKFLRMIVVYVDITAPLYWWKEFDTYKVGTVANSCSTMHKIADKEFTLGDFSHEHLYCGYEFLLENDIISLLNNAREWYNKTKDKKYWWQMVQILPSSYNQKRTVMLNYEVLSNIWKSRRDHKLDEWSGRGCFSDLCRDCNTCAKEGTAECHGGRDGGFIQWIESLPYAKELICDGGATER